MSLDVALVLERPTDVFAYNITHNLGAMAKEAGVYQACWRPEELGIQLAGGLIPILKEGLSKLKADPEYFKKFNPENGWGSYEGLVEFVEEYLAACEQFPSAQVKVDR